MKKNAIPKRQIPYDKLKVAFPLVGDKINKETMLDMEIAEVEIIGTLPQTVRFYSIVRLKDTTVTLDMDILEIYKDAFATLYQDALSMYENNDHHITAVKIWLGLDQDLKMKPLFQPVYIKKNSEDEYNVYDHQNVYDYTGGSFQLCLSANELKKRYRDNIQLMHLGETQFQDFRQNIDTEAIIYPFQTIFTLLVDNLDANDSVTLRNSIAINHTTEELNNKHCLLLYTTKRSDKIIESFKDKYANRSHLCPPGCSKILDFDFF